MKITVVTAIAIAATVIADLHPTPAVALAHGDHAIPAPPPAASDAAPALVAEAPIAGLLAQGVVVIRFQARNITILPVYGAAALGVVPRLGHLHVTIDEAAWHWVHAGTDPVVIQGLAPGPHKVLLELADPAHRAIDAREVDVLIPGKPAAVPQP